jgi:hypothetical protein
MRLFEKQAFAPEFGFESKHLYKINKWSTSRTYICKNEEIKLKHSKNSGKVLVGEKIRRFL